MRRAAWTPLLLTMAAGMLISTPRAAVAQSNERLNALEAAIAAQAEIIARQQQVLDLQTRALQELRREAVAGALLDLRGAGAAAAPAAPAVGTPAPGSVVPPVPQETGPIGTPPPEAATPPAAATPAPPPMPAELPGVLTPRGRWGLDLAIDYSHSSVNRFTFRGVELQEVLLIGVIEATDADRSSYQVALTGRYGLTNRLELEARVPYSTRSDRVTVLIPVLEEQSQLRRETHTRASGIGDAEVAIHYQLTSGLGIAPIMIGNLRLKSITGKGPFEITRDAAGTPLELATGSGFYGLSPSITFIKRSDPAVLFANLGYDINFARSVDAPVGEVIVERVNPGDALQTSVGMGFAVNEQFSFSLSYKYSVLTGSKTQLFQPSSQSRTVQSSNRLYIGSLGVGMSYMIPPNFRVNLDLDFGITGDAPDMRIALRIPLTPLVQRMFSRNRGA